MLQRLMNLLDSILSLKNNFVIYKIYIIIFHSKSHFYSKNIFLEYDLNNKTKIKECDVSLAKWTSQI